MCVERFGVDSIRLTGGEPTVRFHLPVLVGKVAALRTDDGRPVDLALTTNGATLRSVAADLREAGLRRVNVSLDTLRHDRFVTLTRRRARPCARGHRRGGGRGLDPVKVNVVVMRGVNDDEIVDLAEFKRDRGVTVRFIEWMPLDADRQWQSEAVVSQAEIVAAIDAVHPIDPVARGPSRPSGSCTATAPARWARSPRSPGPSATRATASVSPPRAGCGRACSRSTRPTCASWCGAASRRRRGGRGAALRGRQVGWSHDRPGCLRAPPPQHEPDRGLRPRAVPRGWWAGGRPVGLVWRHV